MLKNRCYFIANWLFFFIWCSFVIGYIFYSSYGLDKFFCNFDTAVSFLGGSDGGNFLRAAKDIIDCKNTFFQSWVLGLWPPAMLVLGLIYLSVFSKLISIGVFYTIVLSAIYAIVCMTFLSHIMKKKMPSLLIVPMLLIPYMLSWGEWSFIYFSDPFSNLFFIYGVVLLFSATDSEDVRTYVEAGIAFTIGALFRSHVFLSLFATAFVLVCVLLVKKMNGKSADKIMSALKYTFTVVGMLILAYYVASGGKYCYNKADYIWTLPFVKEGTPWLDEGGIRAARDCDPARGKQIVDALESKEYNKYKNPKYLKWIVVMSPLKYPMFYIRNKLHIGWNSYHSAGFLFVNWILLLIFFAIIIKTFYRFNVLADEKLILFSIMAGAFLASWGPSIILHFEARYLNLFKFAILLGFVYEVVLNYKK